MKHLKLIFLWLFLAGVGYSCDQSPELTVNSPDGNIEVIVRTTEDGSLKYSAHMGDAEVLESSGLGLEREDAGFTNNMKILEVGTVNLIDETYQLFHGKQQNIAYQANEAIVYTESADGEKMNIIFRVSDDGFAFRYFFPDASEKEKAIVSESSSFNFPEGTKGWLQPLSKAKTGFAETNPSYEEEYLQEVPAEIDSPIGYGWVYPALFRSNGIWVLITEAGLDRNYCGTHLDNTGNEYRIAFPQPEEVLPDGALNPNNTLPWYTPWRVVAMGDLSAIVESNLGTSLADPAIDEDFSFVKPGFASWSWVILKDESVNFETQKEFIDFASEMEWEYCLVDGLWDQQIGRDRIKELSEYAQSKDVDLLLWYNSAGSWNSAYQTPKGKMLTAESRAEEFQWLNEMGVKGIKVDFFGGDGQSVIAYYHDIMQDAAKYGIMLNFHGATLPRGWHRTYPNLMTVEAIKGYEFITFGQETADNAPTHMAMAPFSRNVFDPMDFTPINLSGVPNIDRLTTNGYELALSVVFTSGIQHIAETARGITTVPGYVQDFLTGFPDGDWDETLFIEGYPGKLAVIARRDGDAWYVGGINGEDIEKELELELPFVKGSQSANIITDGEEGILSFSQKEVKLNENENYMITLKPHGGFVMELK